VAARRARATPVPRTSGTRLRPGTRRSSTPGRAMFSPPSPLGGGLAVDHRVDRPVRVPVQVVGAPIRPMPAPVPPPPHDQLPQGEVAVPVPAPLVEQARRRSPGCRPTSGEDRSTPSHDEKRRAAARVIDGDEGERDPCCWPTGANDRFGVRTGGGFVGSVARMHLSNKLMRISCRAPGSWVSE